MTLNMRTPWRALLAICLLAAVGPLQAQSLKIFEVNHLLLGLKRYGLKDAEGGIATPAIYDSLVPLAGGGFLANAWPSHGSLLLDAKGATIKIDPAIDEIHSADTERGLLLVGSGGHPALGRTGGVMDAQGRIRIPIQYEGVAYLAGSGLFAVQSARRWGLADADGTLLVPTRYDGVTGVAGGVLLSDPGLELLVDRQGRELVRVEGRSSTIQPLGKTGLFEICRDPTPEDNDATTFCGVIDSSGKALIPVKYQTLLLFEGLSRIAVSEPSWTMLAPPIESFELYDLKGKRVAKVAAESLHNIGDQLVARTAGESRNRYGLMDADGQWLVQPRYASIDPLPQHDSPLVDEVAQPAALLVTVKGESDAEGRSGVLSTDGRELLSPTFEQVYRGFPERDRYVVEQDGKLGVVDGQGRWIVPAEYTETVPDLPWPWLMRMMPRNPSGGNRQTKYALFRMDTGAAVIPPNHDYLSVEASYVPELKDAGFSFERTAIVYGTDEADKSSTIYGLEGQVIARHRCHINGSPDKLGRVPCEQANDKITYVDGLDPARLQQLREAYSRIFAESAAPPPSAEFPYAGKFIALGAARPSLIVHGDEAVIDPSIIPLRPGTAAKYRLTVCPRGQNFALLIEETYPEDADGNEVPACSNPGNVALDFVVETDGGWQCRACAKSGLPSRWSRLQN